MRLRGIGLTALLLLTAGPAAGEWGGQFARVPELNIRALAETPEGFVGAGPSVQYVNAAGEVEFHVLRFYENGQWRTGGDIGGIGFFSGSITTVTLFRGDVCVGGNFTNFGPDGFNFLACYGTASGEWYQPGGNGNGPNNAVNSVWFDGGVYLYIGGDFTEVKDAQGAPITTNRVARTTGAVWEALTGDGGATNGVLAPVKRVRTFNGFVFVASGSSVFRYNPTNTTWTPFGLASFNTPPLPAPVDDLAFFSNEVIASGPYDTIGGEEAPGIATSSVASGPDWRTLDDGSQGHGSGEPLMAASSSYLYVLGPWPDLTGADGLARWTGFAWEAVDTEALGVNVATTLQDIVTQPSQRVCVRHGGLIDADLASAAIACKSEPTGSWHGTSQGIDQGADRSVQALASYQGEIYAAGNFLSAGDDAAASVIARWDGNRWSAVGGGVTGEVFSLAVHRGELFAAGNVTGAGGNATGGLVAWNGSRWRDAGGPGVLASQLYSFRGSLYFFGIGGNCGTVLSRVCRFDGSSIEEAASGSIQPVSVDAVAEYQGRLLVAGNFLLGPGVRQDLIAALDNGTWDIVISLGAGQSIKALASDAEYLYFGGRFNNNVPGATGPLNGIARWDGSSISALGGGLADAGFSSLDIELHRGLVVVTGDFASAGGVEGRGIAAWDGSRWNGLQGGMIDTPFPGLGIGQITPGIGNALLSTPAGLYVGGVFDQIGRRFAGNIALLTGDPVFTNSFEPP